MLSQPAQVGRQSPIYPASTIPVVTELFDQNHSTAEAQIWRELQTKDGAVWHRQTDRGLADLSERLREVAPQLQDWQDGYVLVSRPEQLETALERTVDTSPLVTQGLLSADQIGYLKDQYISMYQLISSMTGRAEVILDLRIEKSHAYIENYHQDFGTALLMSLVGPGPHFIHPDNQPVEHNGAFFREDLRDPDQIFEVPTRSLLAMRGKLDSEEGEHEPPQGLWHSSPPKDRNGVTQWDTRVLLIATSPHSEILPPHPPVGI